MTVHTYIGKIWNYYFKYFFVKFKSAISDEFVLFVCCRCTENSRGEYGALHFKLGGNLEQLDRGSQIRSQR